MAIIAGPVRLVIEAPGIGASQLALPAAARESVSGGLRLYSSVDGKGW
ncbi:hypothetical protein WEI85_00245 [Actinomycetes bacterium KLBMP 9797]